MAVVFHHETKQPGEKYPVAVDLVNRLASGETLSLVSATASREDDGSDQTAAFLDGAATIDGTKVKVTVKNGVDGKDYKVSFVVTTSAGHILEPEVVVPVVAL